MSVLVVVIIGVIMLATGAAFHGALRILSTSLSIIALGLAAFILLRMLRVDGGPIIFTRRAGAGNHKGRGNGFR
jgi:hypothetical protein